MVLWYTVYDEATGQTVEVWIDEKLLNERLGE